MLLFPLIVGCAVSTTPNHFDKDCEEMPSGRYVQSMKVQYSTCSNLKVGQIFVSETVIDQFGSMTKGCFTRTSFLSQDKCSGNGTYTCIFDGAKIDYNYSLACQDESCEMVAGSVSIQRAECWFNYSVKYWLIE